MKRILFFVASCAIIAACNNKAADTTAAKTDSSSATANEPKTAPPAEFADQKFVEIGKKMSEQFASGNMDEWASNFADNAVYRFSAGDSLAGKEAIVNYWKGRRMSVIDSISFNNNVWLPIKVNKSQNEKADTPGNWLLNWYLVNVKYKNGKKLMLAVHVDSHFDSSDKIDQVIHYMDTAPIKALGAK